MTSSIFIEYPESNLLYSLATLSGVPALPSLLGLSPESEIILFTNSIKCLSSNLLHKFNYDISAGPHTLSWTYSKDGAADSGRDAGWLDQVVIASLSNYTPNAVSSGDMIFDVEWVNVSDRNDVLRMDVLFPEESIENPPQVSFEPVEGCILTIYDDVNNETSRFVTPVLNFSSTEPLNYNEDLVGQSGFTDFNLRVFITS